jgi:branched-chain amino acid transport system substrate-binding protein
MSPRPVSRQTPGSTYLRIPELQSSALIISQSKGVTLVKRFTSRPCLLTLIFCATIAVLPSCKRDDPSPQGVTLAALLPLTGDNASYGQDCQKGIELAIENHNSSGRERSRVVFEDTRADPQIAVTVMNKILSVDRPDVIVGDMFSTTTLAVAPLAQRQKKVLITPTASLEDIVQVGDHIFSIYPSDRYEGELDARVALDDGSRSFGVLQQQVAVFATMADSFRAKVEESGATVPYFEVFPSGNRDFRTLLAKHSGVDIDAVYVAAYKTEAFQIIRQLREQGFRGKVYSQSTLYDPETLTALGTAAEGIVFSAPFFTDQASSESIVAFRSAYQRKFGVPPNVWAAYGYDVASLALEAVEQARKSGAPLHMVVASMSFEGVTGTTRFTTERTAEKTMRIFTVRDGKFVEYVQGNT